MKKGDNSRHTLGHVEVSCIRSALGYSGGSHYFFAKIPNIFSKSNAGNTCVVFHTNYGVGKCLKIRFCSPIFKKIGKTCSCISSGQTANINYSNDCIFTSDTL